MTADSDKKLCAASFEFTYDKSMFEFRSAKVSDKTSKIAYNELSDKVKLVFLNADGININNSESIFTLTFKAVKSGTGYIDFFVSDCVDSDINSIDAGKCTSAKITVNSKSEKYSSDKSNSSDKSGKSEASGSKSERKKTEETTSVSSYDEIGQLNSFDNPNTRLLIIGIVLGASLIAAVMLAYNIFKRIKSNRNKRKNSPDE
ncbi:MAG: cohesin domain-containing protein [Ruminococcus sp.]|nr:cohesin domain-containing protein [Ruminococcus sp.]